MYTDAQNLFSDAQAVSTSAASTNVIDVGVEGRLIGQGEPLAVVFQVDEAADYTTEDETYAVAVQTDTVENFASATTLQTETIAAASLTAGARFVWPLGHVNERYIRMYFTHGGTTPTCTYTAYLVPMSMLEADTKYADGFTITDT